MRTDEDPNLGRTPTWLTSDAPAIGVPRRRVPPALWVGGALLAVVVVLAGIAFAVVRSVSAPTVGSARPVAAEMPVPAAESAPPEPWCVESVEGGRSVGRGPGSTSDGPGAIRAFDHAYYVERDGGRVASLMVDPNPVAEIQRWIDAVPAGTEHCVTVVSTSTPDVYDVELGLRMPGRADGVIRQTVTVVPSPDGYRIARVEDA
ncbi:hypothetical protein [Prescottella sp. R16]|uniref:hypothetical protein n=1 Tax=Prescottella sp. R16 TaxID=3064529 RepID=UPI00272E9D4E|nr:hypothetical protein [Prescottella sp. R16]